MSRRFVVQPLARLELAEATDWYDAANPDLGSEFLRAFQATAAAILRNPHQYQAAHGEMRRAPLRKFPYNLYYVVSDDEIAIVSCFHWSRDPRRWEDQI